MGHIFISYSRLDHEIVNRMVNSMESAGMEVWIDREDIKVGNSWRVQIVEAIDTCDAFVFMLSSNSAASQNVQKEVILAQDSSRPTYVVMLEVVRLPPEIRYQLAGLQFINYPLLGHDKSTSQLIETLKPHIKKIVPDGEGGHKQAELVIQGINLSAFTAEKQEQLLAFISNLANTDQSQLKIANMTAGSVHVFVDMPAAAAFQLKTMAMNSDPRFSALGMASLRLIGDKQFVNVSTGLLVPTPTVNSWTALWLRIPALFSSMVGVAATKLLTLVIALLLIILIGVAIPKQTPAPLLTSVVEEASASPSPVLASISTNTLTAAPANTALPTSTETSTQTPAAIMPLAGVIDADQLACRYGPGVAYLFDYGLIKGNKVDVLGQAFTSAGTWVYVKFDEKHQPCWVNLKYVEVKGDVSTLAQVYPNPAPLILFHNPKFPPPTDVTAAREGDQVDITWKGIELGLGDRESADSPVFLVELWTCQSGKIVFTAYGAFDESALITDAGSCSEPSHGQVFLAHKDGYVGPVAIPWPAP